MVIEIGPIAKPQIWLIGDEIKASTIRPFSERVDHARAVEGLVVTGVTTLKQENVLTFDRKVRIIITSAYPLNKPLYNREEGVLATTEFEGNRTFSSKINLVNNVAETYYTLNGKDPVRTSAHLYNYLDINNRPLNINSISATTNPSSPDDPSFQEITDGSLDGLGFMLATSPTGNEIITLKTRTFYHGNKSNVAIAIFKVISDSVVGFENFDPQKTI